VRKENEQILRFCGGKRLKCVVDHLIAFNANVKNEWNCTYAS
jgi:hypothetical protein